MAREITDTIYHVTDLKGAVAYYAEKFGCQVDCVHDWGWAELTLDGTGHKIGLLLESTVRKPGDPYPVPRLGIRTDDIDAEVSALLSRGVRVDALKGERGTMRAVNFYDKDGNAFFLWDDGRATSSAP